MKKYAMAINKQTQNNMMYVIWNTLFKQLTHYPFQLSLIKRHISESKTEPMSTGYSSNGITGHHRDISMYSHEICAWHIYILDCLLKMSRLKFNCAWKLGIVWITITCHIQIILVDLQFFLVYLLIKNSLYKSSGIGGVNNYPSCMKVKCSCKSF